MSCDREKEATKDTEVHVDAQLGAITLSSTEPRFTEAKPKEEHAENPGAAAIPLKVLEITDPTLKGNPKYQGLSVYYLQNCLLKEVQNAGFSRTARIYELENVHAEEPGGFIRQKGANETCPMTQTQGAAYVHCLQGKDNVGDATHMLSYTWGYTIGDIVDTIVGVCEADRLDPKRTYFWICCFCVNQHQVAADIRLSNAVTTEQFVAEFESRVIGIGRIVCMMSPWEKPKYLTRVWCIFEIATAFDKGVRDVIVAMPPCQKQRLVKTLIHGRDSSAVNSLYKALANTKVQNGKATEDSDREYILGRLRKQKGGYNSTNESVNTNLRAWVRQVLENFVRDHARQVEKPGTSKKQRLEHAYVCNNVGFVYLCNGENAAALVECRKAVAIAEAILGEGHPDTAASYDTLGRVLCEKGDYSAALEEHRKALAIQEPLGVERPDTASIYSNIGLVLGCQGDYSGALVEYRKALAIHEALSNKDHPNTTRSYKSNGVGLVHLGGDYRKPLVVNRTALNASATLYVNIGSVLCKQGNFSEALVEYRKALTVFTALHKEHPDTAAAYCGIGSVLRHQGDYKGALRAYDKAVAIRKTVLGREHPKTAAAFKAMALVFAEIHKKRGTQGKFA